MDVGNIQARSTYAYTVTDLNTGQQTRLGPAAAQDVTIAFGVLGKNGPPDVQLLDSSAQTQMEYNGTPYSSVTLDYNRDSMSDLMITMQDGSSVLFRADALLAGGIPQMRDATFEAFSLPLSSGARGLTAVDIDNDIDTDLFVAHQSDAALYRNSYNETLERWEFEDIASDAGISPYSDDSWAGAWADYDRDNDLDLFICRASSPGADPDPATIVPMTDVLLRNDLSTTGFFTNVSGVAGGMATALTAPVCASWADVDDDGDIDLLVPGLMDFFYAETAKLYINDGKGGFGEGFTSFFGTPDLYWVSGISWLDADGDGRLDAVFSTQYQSGSSQRLFLHGDSGFTESSIDLTMTSLGVQTVDIDLDGRRDLLFLPSSSTESPVLLRNDSVLLDPVFTDVSSEIGLISVGRTEGVVASDFNAGNWTGDMEPASLATTDGDSDIYLGRPDSESFFFRNKRQDSQEAPAGNFVSIVLVSSGANNASSIGVAVTATYGSPTVMEVQQVDGGSGRGGQNDRVLTFGLGAWGGPVELSIAWPGGHVQQVTIPAADLNPSTPIAITDTTNPTISQGSLSCSIAVQADNGLMEWTFEWITDVSSKWSRDKVVLTGPGSFGTITRWAFQIEDPNCKVVTPLFGGGYHHKLVLKDVPCTPGTYSYSVTSSTTTETGDTSNGTYLMRFCPTF